MKPLAMSVTVEISEAKGSKIFKKELQTDIYGMASTDLPLSTEPNLGVWKVTAALNGKIKTQLDMTVDKYVLPKYEITVTPAKEWLLVSEKTTGTVKAEYSYGKPVQGEVEIRALKYTGTWQEFANITKPLDGQTDFELPAPQYVARCPGGERTRQCAVRGDSTREIHWLRRKNSTESHGGKLSSGFADCA